MADITLPGTRPTGDDQQWKREVQDTLTQIQALLRVIQSER